ncbi:MULTISPECIES: PilZ domain-containing protein [Legionella]|uniref:Pilus assembly protein PilZ n=1 Tax=Legionella septentrionalis TaxID=2498109 RepID=A0A3S0XFF7_9GAMM|nr:MULTISPECIES: PilZ domain-containing protein [Legionella]MCP0914408.1 PilZ domain-containing protein [Legionella sp. 27cVA30]RUQ81876.1 pilus assembly protein PilZ [Legionella septentrionalis]RUR00246.1 pilus assembly protein PilZ [Legionella septentrionalis]RUR09418.1 pilus assembly protein PilZ [Legionella septentrionalis]RUR17585.1 pilus assembly protein PilZ [Legionella septentrionalis]
MAEDAQLLICSFRDEDALYHAYMPFIKGGGLFIRTTQNYQLGSAVNLSVRLLDEPESDAVEGKVVWLTPKGAQGNKPVGIGVQFIGEQGRYLANKIETYLAGMLKSSQMTDTI